MFDFNWYQTLMQPPLTPPAWVFPPVWTFLYILMFIALIIYGKKHSYKKKSWGFILFFTQLLVNLSWSPIFFGMRNMGLALAIVILLDVLVLLTIIEFYKVSKTAGKLLFPYFIWILFATYLNIAFLVLN